MANDKCNVPLGRWRGGPQKNTPLPIYVANTIQYNTIQYNTIQYNTIKYNTIQYNTIQYNTIPQYLPTVVRRLHLQSTYSNKPT